MSGTDERLDRWAAVETLILRVLFPLWLGAGAIFKLVNGGPATLPVVLVKGLGGLGVDLMFVLGLSIAIELTVIGVVWLLPSLARTAAVSILGLFIVILAADIGLGAPSCGCFGSIQLSPWFTMAVDGLLLAAILVLGRRRRAQAPGSGATPWGSAPVARWRVLVILVWALAAVTAGFGILAHRSPRMSGASDIGGAAAGAAATSGADASMPPVPAYYLPEYESWVGRPWTGIDLAGWVRGAPADLDAGLQYILFYRKDCEHCHELMEFYFSGELTTPTLAVAVPEKQGFPTQGLKPMACEQCRLAELPSGCDWFLATPVLVRLQDGVVECAAEVDPAAPECLQW